MGKHFDPVDFLASLSEGTAVKHYCPGTPVFTQGDPARVVYFLQTGKIKEIVLSEQGKEAVVGVLESGQFFGAGALDGGPVRLSTTKAMTSSAVTEITKDAMRNSLRIEPAFNQLFMAYLLRHNAQIEAEKVNLLFNSSEKRLANRLLLLAHVTEGPLQVVSSDITQEMMADMIGSTRQRVNSFLTRFRKLGFIEYGRKGAGGIVVNPSLLVSVLQGWDDA